MCIFYVLVPGVVRLVSGLALTLGPVSCPNHLCPSAQSIHSFQLPETTRSLETHLQLPPVRTQSLCPTDTLCLQGEVPVALPPSPQGPTSASPVWGSRQGRLRPRDSFLGSPRTSLPVGVHAHTCCAGHHVFSVPTTGRSLLRRGLIP